MKMNRRGNWCFLLVLAQVCLLLHSGSAQTAGVGRHVVVIGVDGMSPDGIANAETPNMDRMMAEGAYTMEARAVLPTSSSPNWASMIMGAGPEQHGITSNAWERDNVELEPIARGRGGIFPTIFSLIREQHPDAVVGCFHDWSGFGRLFEKEAADVVEDTPGPETTTERAVEFIQNRKPTFTFVHLDHVDHAGHAEGHGTGAYYAAVEEADHYIGLIWATLNQTGLIDDTILIVTSDHGGKGKGHGGATQAEVEIPWIAVGKGVKAGYRIEAPVDTYDTAATVAHVLGVKPPEAWIAKPVLSALEH